MPPKAVVEKEQQWHTTQGKSLQKEMKRRQLANIAWVILTDLLEELVVESAAALHAEGGCEFPDKTTHFPLKRLIFPLKRLVFARNLGGVSMQFGDEILLSSIRGACFSIVFCCLCAKNDRFARCVPVVRGKSKDGCERSVFNGRILISY